MVFCLNNAYYLVITYMHIFMFMTPYLCSPNVAIEYSSSLTLKFVPPDAGADRSLINLLMIDSNNTQG